MTQKCCVKKCRKHATHHEVYDEDKFGLQTYHTCDFHFSLEPFQKFIFPKQVVTQ